MDSKNLACAAGSAIQSGAVLGVRQLEDDDNTWTRYLGGEENKAKAREVLALFSGFNTKEAAEVLHFVAQQVPYLSTVTQNESPEQ